jgi:hypothetical protein
VQGDTAPSRNNSTRRRSEAPRRDKREMEEAGTQMIAPRNPRMDALAVALVLALDTSDRPRSILL